MVCQAIKNKDKIDFDKINFDKIKNTRIEFFQKIMKPIELNQLLPITKPIEQLVFDTRNSISDILKGIDQRMLFIVGPCSIHNIEEAKIYGAALKVIADQVKEIILIVMRVYFL